MKGISYFLGCFVALMFCFNVASVSAQDTNRPIRRKVVHYSMLWAGEDFAYEIDYVDIEWSYETENWWQKVLDENRGKFDEDTIEYYERARNYIEDAGLGNLRTLTLTFHFNDKYEGSNKIGYIKLLGGQIENNVSVFWNMSSAGGVPAYWTRSNLAWYTGGWSPIFVAINPVTWFAGHRNGVSYSGYEPIDPEKGKNKLVLADMPPSSLSGEEVGIIIELDGPFF